MSTQNTEHTEKIYLIFSMTTTKVGKMIRRVTKYPYNHVSVSLTPDLAVIYSFARHYKDMPFYGGFVCEGIKRFCNEAGLAKIMVCAVPVTRAQYECALNLINEVSENNKYYIYNIISAAFVPMHIRVFIDRAYTCCEFAVEFLAHCNIAGAPDPRRFCSIEELTERFKKYAIFEGPFNEYEHAVSDIEDYERKNAVAFRMGKTVATNARLFGRFFKGILSNK
ncbi:MAG TPA: hypothetical protein GX011_02550 [Clostridiales bacterium]|jgi:hypothetical protein|nr:hypothetical protein [Clostridiales bacterium]